MTRNMSRSIATAKAVRAGLPPQAFFGEYGEFLSASDERLLANPADESPFLIEITQRTKFIELPSLDFHLAVDFAERDEAGYKKSIGHFIDDLANMAFLFFAAKSRHPLFFEMERLGRLKFGISMGGPQLIEHYEKLKSREFKTLFLYFSGHGAFVQERGHYLYFHLGSAFRKEIEANMILAIPDLKILITDSCASRSERMNPPIGETLATINFVANTSNYIEKITGQMRRTEWRTYALEKLAEEVLPPLENAEKHVGKNLQRLGELLIERMEKANKDFGHNSPPLFPLADLLFFNRGTANINSAEILKVSWGKRPEGGRFSDALRALFNDSNSIMKRADSSSEHPASWHTAFYIARAATEEATQAHGPDAQTPIAFGTMADLASDLMPPPRIASSEVSSAPVVEAIAPPRIDILSLMNPLTNMMSPMTMMNPLKNPMMVDPLGVQGMMSPEAAKMFGFYRMTSPPAEQK